MREAVGEKVAQESDGVNSHRRAISLQCIRVGDGGEKPLNYRNS